MHVKYGWADFPSHRLPLSAELNYADPRGRYIADSKLASNITQNHYIQESHSSRTQKDEALRQFVFYFICILQCLSRHGTFCIGMLLSIFLTISRKSLKAWKWSYTLIHKWSYLERSWPAIRNSLRLNVLLKDSLACREQRIKLPTLWLVENWLYHLRDRHPEVRNQSKPITYA